MRATNVILLCLLFVACAAVRDDMRRAEAAFDDAQYEHVEVWLSDLEGSLPEMDRPARARYYYLRGVAAYRLGEPVKARHYLALCREEAQPQGLGLRSEWRTTLATLLSQIDLSSPKSSGDESTPPPA